MATQLKTGFELTENALTVLKERYLLRNEKNEVIETPEALFFRVAQAIAGVEERGTKKWSNRFYELMATGRFLPNSPTLMNAGKKEGQLSACFVLPVEDSLESIFGTLREAAKIHQSGGGTGFSFSRVRAKGSRVRSSQGIASGPMSFIRIFDVATETIKQGGKRRGANMAVLQVDHPDVLEFIHSKRDLSSSTNFNISVGVTDQFMQAVAEDRDFSLVDQHSGQVVKTLRARAIFDQIAESAWHCGDPGLIFLDRVNLFNPTPEAGEMESTNPCGEQPLLPYESCNLGSINVALYIQDGKMNWKLFKEDIIDCVRFLDNVIDANTYPVKECEKITKKNRKIGLGVMGFADALLALGIPYTSKEALSFGEKLMSVLDRQAKAASVALAKEKGAFANWKGSLWQRLGYPKMRNATVSTVAPTGTISVIAGASSGIEPIFSGVFYRNVLSGRRLLDVHPALKKELSARGHSVEAVERLDLEKTIGAAWTPAYKVSIDSHVRMQAMFQRSCDSAVSKTINLPESATVDDVKKAYTLAHSLGCKGITVYRDKSRPTQVLEEKREVVSAAERGIVCEGCD